MKIKILIAAGGTGGHLFPAQQLSEKLLKDGDCEIFFAGHKLAETPFFKREGVFFEEIASAPLKNVFLFFAAVWKGFFQSLRLIRSFKPDAVVGFGSFHSFPVLLAAAVLRKKIVLFEANCLLGKVNRLFIPLACKVALQFPVEKKLSGKEAYVPLLPWNFSMKKHSQNEARISFQLKPDLFTILVFGGSQGASFLNQAFCEAARLLKQKGLQFQVIHLTGKEGKASYEGMDIPVCVKTFEQEMHLAYGAADLVVCRSGAGTVAELIRFQKPAILIPFPYASEDHQKVNGKYLSETIGGSRLLLQAEARPERLAEEILGIKDELQKRKDALQKICKETEGRAHFAQIIRSVAIEKRKSIQTDMSC